MNYNFVVSAIAVLTASHDLIPHLIVSGIKITKGRRFMNLISCGGKSKVKDDDDECLGQPNHRNANRGNIISKDYQKKSNLTVDHSSESDDEDVHEIFKYQRKFNTHDYAANQNYRSDESTTLGSSSSPSDEFESRSSASSTPRSNYSGNLRMIADEHYDESDDAAIRELDKFFDTYKLDSDAVNTNKKASGRSAWEYHPETLKGVVIDPNDLMHPSELQRKEAEEKFAKKFNGYLNDIRESVQQKAQRRQAAINQGSWGSDAIRAAEEYNRLRQLPY